MVRYVHVTFLTGILHILYSIMTCLAIPICFYVYIVGLCGVCVWPWLLWIPNVCIVLVLGTVRVSGAVLSKNPGGQNAFGWYYY